MRNQVFLSDTMTNNCVFYVFPETQEQPGRTLVLWAQKYPKSSTQFEKDMIKEFGQIMEVSKGFFLTD